MSRNLSIVFRAAVSIVFLAGHAIRPEAQDVSAERGSISISIEIEGDEREGRWIRSDTVIIRSYPIGLDSLRSVLEDLESYPRFFPRLARTTVMARGEAFAVIRQRYEIAILGYRYPAEYDLMLEATSSSSPERWTLSWRLAGSDGSVGKSVGSWTLEADPSEPGRTLVAHRNRGSVRKRFPLQLGIMRAVAERELSRSIDAVFYEARRREAVLAKAETE